MFLLTPPSVKQNSSPASIVSPFFFHCFPFLLSPIFLLLYSTFATKGFIIVHYKGKELNASGGITLHTEDPPIERHF